MPLPNGTTVGPYAIVGWIGAGGMGDVYRARDPRLGRDVAIKLIAERFATDRSRLHRFEQEARAAGQINHPNILAVYDIGTHNGMPYIVSELLEGESLGARLRGGAVPFRKAIHYARQMAAGLAAAHDKNLVHRDLKPDNVFVTNDERVKILDFGIAKLTGPSDDATRQTGAPTETAEGMVVGTAGYMSPEQLRGESVDGRSDIFSFGVVLYEMLAGQPAFVRPTAAETVAAILKEDPAELRTLPATIAKIVSRCLEKPREARFQSARDLEFALEFLAGSTGAATAVATRDRDWRLAGTAAVALLSVAAAVWMWWRGASAVDSSDSPLADAEPSLLVSWDGTDEEGAEISPDGRLVAFLSDQAGEFDIWLTQVGSASFRNLTANIGPLAASGFIVRKLGFTGDGSEIWFNPGDGKLLMRMPWAGGPARNFLLQGANTPAWSPDGRQLVYVYKPNRDDPVYLADGTGADPIEIMAPGPLKNINPVWSPDGQWIYFARGSEPQDETTMNVWRLRPTGGAPEQVTDHHVAANFLTALDARTLLYVARDRNGAGPWLWSLDVTRGQSRRVPTGVDQFTSVSASRDGRRIVATVANPTASFWRVPLRDRLVEENEAEPYPLPTPTGRVLAPRFSRTALFYLSSRGTRDGLWKVENGQSTEVWRETEGTLFEPPAISPQGDRLAVAIRRDGKRYLSVMSTDGTNARTLAPDIQIEGAAGQTAADWSPDGTRIVTGGRDARGPALFIIPIDGGAPVRLLEGTWVNPIWSPDERLIVYAGRSVIGQVELLGIRPDGTPVKLPQVMVRPGGYRFVPGGGALVFVQRIQGVDFWRVDLATNDIRQLTRLGNKGVVRTFDVTPDGQAIVFDRLQQNSNIALFERK